METVKPEVINDDLPRPAFNGGPAVKLNVMDSLQSPWFWVVAGLALGVWLCKNKTI